MTELITIQPVRIYDVPFSLTVSTRDCTGDVDGRRGFRKISNQFIV
ncbi:hypothetical protein LEP1GSC170_0257 [Leptospira interrogans serovar Bataviae str. HAI135]|nr:hypothetical protein LEP1GSC170_0257 [Leptospira interrogans serovar Bataviae str. HAI135]